MKARGSWVGGTHCVERQALLGKVEADEGHDGGYRRCLVFWEEERLLKPGIDWAHVVMMEGERARLEWKSG